tara:strand:+ start:925 stop:1998 length:1074 start_codon:yes stop_codon:yes gene_type:complete
MSVTKAIQQLNKLIGVTASTKPLTTVQIDTFARFLSQASQKKANTVLASVQNKLEPENYSLLIERMLAHKGLSPGKYHDIGAASSNRNLSRTALKEHDVTQEITPTTQKLGKVYDPDKGWVERVEHTRLDPTRVDIEDDLTREVTKDVEFFQEGGDPFLSDPVRARAGAGAESRQLDAAQGVGSTKDPLRERSLSELSTKDPILRNAAQGAMQAPLSERGGRVVRGIRDGLPLGSKVKSAFSPEEIRETIRLSKDLPKEFAGERNTALFGNKTPLDSSKNPIAELVNMPPQIGWLREGLARGGKKINQGKTIPDHENPLTRLGLGPLKDLSGGSLPRPLEVLDIETLQRMLSQGNLY